jgi:bifunctional DNase/RNase
MEYIELEVLDVESSQSPSEAYALVLRDKDAKREMTIVIGIQEARTLVLIQHKIQTRRPGTHELFKNFMQQTGYDLEKVLIHKYDEGVFYALLIAQRDLDNFELDARTSDAVAIAMLMNAPILIKKAIFDKLSVEARKEEPKVEDFNPDIDLEPEELDMYIENKLSEMSLEELEPLLQGAIGSEDFELASKIHNEINSRKN